MAKWEREQAIKLNEPSFIKYAKRYVDTLSGCFNSSILEQVEILANDLIKTWENKGQIFICGNGGSAANAIHIANDFLYGVGACGEGAKVPGIKVEALSANSGIITCLANDTGYENIFSSQLEVKGCQDDLLIALSGSGNSENIIKAIKVANMLQMKTSAIVAFSGGKCKEMANHAIHIPINDMQIAEDSQLIIAHICMQFLTSNKPNFKS